MLPSNRCPWALTYTDGSYECVMDLGKPKRCEGDREKCPFGDFSAYDPDLEMHISEIYPAISGEGATAGTVCTIIRTVGCNLRCSYCDTTYAYEGGDIVSTKDILDAVLKFGIHTVLFTGGEPLLNKQVASNFLRALFENEISAFVETNGSIDIRPFIPLAHMVLDIKCPSSGMSDKMFWDNIQYIGFDDEIKFVISNAEDYEFAKGIIEKQQLIKRTQHIFMSPAWSDDKSFFQELSNWLVVDRSPAKLSIQQHKVIWGPKERGV